MSKKFINAVHLNGFVHSHKLEKKVSGSASKNPGTEYIRGDVNIATDNKCLNVVTVHFRYVTAVTARGTNDTYNILERILNNDLGNVMDNGKDNAAYVRIDTAIALNEFYDKNDMEKLVSNRRLEGGFIHLEVCPEEGIDESKSATFNEDIVINNCVRYEADDERGKPERVVIKGAVFDFRKALLPVEFTAVNPAAMDYFEGLEASPKNPVFTRIQGKIISQTVVKKIEEESAFGEAIVKETPQSYKDYVVNWAQQTPYEWDSEDTILASELQDYVAAREIALATIKKNQLDYQNKANNNAIGSGTGVTVNSSKNDYDF